jgi:hypothetical protein
MQTVYTLEKKEIRDICNAVESCYNITSAALLRAAELIEGIQHEVVYDCRLCGILRYPGYR